MIRVAKRVLKRLCSDVSDTALFSRRSNMWVFDLYVTDDEIPCRFTLCWPIDTPPQRLADCRKLIMDRIAEGKIRTMEDLKKWAVSVRDVAKMKNKADKLAAKCAKGGQGHE